MYVKTYLFNFCLYLNGTKFQSLLIMHNTLWSIQSSNLLLESILRKKVLSFLIEFQTSSTLKVVKNGLMEGIHFDKSRESLIIHIIIIYLLMAFPFKIWFQLHSKFVSKRHKLLYFFGFLQPPISLLIFYFSPIGLVKLLLFILGSNTSNSLGKKLPHMWQWVFCDVLLKKCRKRKKMERWNHKLLKY